MYSTNSHKVGCSVQPAFSFLSSFFSSSILHQFFLLLYPILLVYINLYYSLFFTRETLGGLRIQSLSCDQFCLMIADAENTIAHTPNQGPGKRPSFNGTQDTRLNTGGRKRWRRLLQHAVTTLIGKGQTDRQRRW